MGKLITILTATYNRAHLLPDLYQSLCRQTCEDFEWIIVDDGSTDNTKTLVNKWMAVGSPIKISYVEQKNGGKNRAINEGVLHVKTPYVMIVDSDDYLTNDAIAYLNPHLLEAMGDQSLAGIAALRGINENSPLNEPNIIADEFVVCNNLDRKKHGLQYDACEVYKTSILLKHPFEVWEGEKFVPEEIVWDAIALEGYSLRWYNKVALIVRYQDEGMTKGSQKLMSQNPMGYAMLYKHRVELSHRFKEKYYWNCQLIAHSVLGCNFSYVFKDNITISSILAMPIGALLAIRRKCQYANRIIS